MKEKTYKILSWACLAAGYASMAGSLALWGTGRSRGKRTLQNDGLFVGLWVPTFFILSDRFEVAAIEALAEESMFGEHADEMVQGRLTSSPRVPKRWREEIREGSQSVPVQSPRPLQHTLNREER